MNALLRPNKVDQHTKSVNLQKKILYSNLKVSKVIRGQETFCILDSDWSKIVPLCDVSDAAGPYIQKSTFN